MNDVNDVTQKIKCFLYNTLRIIIDERLIDRHGYNPNDVAALVYRCCVHHSDNEGHPLGCITMDDVKYNNVYNKLMELYSDNNLYKMSHGCNRLLYSVITNTQILDCNGNDYICEWNHGKLMNVQVCTPSCNLKCIMCRENIYVNNKMDDIYFNIIEQLKGKEINTLSFTELGEPFLHKDKMMNYLRNLSPKIDFSVLSMISNVTLLNDDDIMELVNIRNKGFDLLITASVDGITKETYSQIRRNDLFDKVVHNVKLIADNNMLSMINYVVQPLNLHELELVEDFWKNINPNININLLPLYGMYDKMLSIINDYKKVKNNIHGECDE